MVARKRHEKKVTTKANQSTKVASDINGPSFQDPAPKSNGVSAESTDNDMAESTGESTGNMTESLVHVPQSSASESNQGTNEGTTEQEQNEKVPCDGNPTAPSSERTGRKLSYLAILNLALKRFDSRYSARNDLFLSSTGYPALFLSALLRKKLPMIATKLGAYSYWISDYRTGWRVITTPATITWALDLIEASKSNPNKWLRASDRIQAVSGVAYQLLENLAFFASKNVVNLSSNAQEVIWAVSSMTWAVHVVLELLKAIACYLQGKPVNRLSLWTNISWAPLAIHWSTRKGIFDARTVGLLGSLATVPRLLAVLLK